MNPSDYLWIVTKAEWRDRDMARRRQESTGSMRLAVACVVAMVLLGVTCFWLGVR